MIGSSHGDGNGLGNLSIGMGLPGGGAMQQMTSPGVPTFTAKPSPRGGGGRDRTLVQTVDIPKDPKSIKEAHDAAQAKLAKLKQQQALEDAAVKKHQAQLDAATQAKLQKALKAKQKLQEQLVKKQAAEQQAALAIAMAKAAKHKAEAALVSAKNKAAWEKKYGKSSGNMFKDTLQKAIVDLNNQAKKDEEVASALVKLAKKEDKNLGKAIVKYKKEVKKLPSSMQPVQGVTHMSDYVPPEKTALQKKMEAPIAFAPQTYMSWMEKNGKANPQGMNKAANQVYDWMSIVFAGGGKKKPGMASQDYPVPANYTPYINANPAAKELGSLAFMLLAWGDVGKFKLLGKDAYGNNEFMIVGKEVAVLPKILTKILSFYKAPPPKKIEAVTVTKKKELDPQKSVKITKLKEQPKEKIQQIVKAKPIKESDQEGLKVAAGIEKAQQKQLAKELAQKKESPFITSQAKLPPPTLDQVLATASPMQAYSALVDTWALYKKSNPKLPPFNKLPIPDVAKNNIKVLMGAFGVLAKTTGLQSEFTNDFAKILANKVKLEGVPVIKGGPGGKGPVLAQTQAAPAGDNMMLYGGVALAGLALWYFKFRKK
jgi:hypothetical protein